MVNFTPRAYLVADQENSRVQCYKNKSCLNKDFSLTYKLLHARTGSFSLAILKIVIKSRQDHIGHNLRLLGMFL
jgi:hypothetical protein